MEVDDPKEKLDKIREKIIAIAASTFNLLLALRNDDEEGEPISLVDSLKKAFQDHTKSSQKEHSSTILSIIRELDTLQDKIAQERKLWTELANNYDEFVDTQTSQKIKDKNKRYQIASDFFSFMATTIMGQKRDSDSYFQTVKGINTRLERLENDIASTRGDDLQDKIDLIIDYADTLENLIGQMLKELNIEPAQILPQNKTL